ncbi:TetR/AcrR family transcriptional regulator [Rhodoferax saidenbachensis]|uniref:TetR/AcrR family transcriptional repressor of nem operon n=1 Tax=Rhodoferax saidenbachensis TaxID=1484693 RepID=A0ABU1ZNZ3_9BURK|nr:TetR/AcrR family transcriptional regulator [Rhodoferax saidenbachensis]MDR7307258.1 TetR/AcrR family transcriptional repressor of nem operon [Rhodoferax saidenbachensis]
MKVTREQANQNRDRVLEVAGRLFRERGFDGIGVADLMKSAGLTHGGFYGQFASKEELMAEACERTFDKAADFWAQLAERAEGNPLAAVMQAYLSKQHRDNPGEGCVMAALGADAARQGPSLRQAVTGGTRKVLDLFTNLAPGRAKALKRERAVLAYASMVGALILARAVDDEALSDEILQTVVASLPG